MGEVIPAAVITAAIGAIREHLEQCGMLPELRYKKKTLIRNGRKPK